MRCPESAYLSFYVKQTQKITLIPTLVKMSRKSLFKTVEVEACNRKKRKGSVLQMQPRQVEIYNQGAE